MSKNIEEKYKILEQIDHVLLRPQTYVGSDKLTNKDCWILDNGYMVIKNINYVPSFIKIFDEIIMNCVDESKRGGSKLNTIKVNISGDEISVWDNGGIPVVMHKTYKIYVPEVIFGNLMSGSNYDDNESRTYAGLNGLGAKLTNIFSKEFKVITCDGKKKFIQVFSENMRNKGTPKISKSSDRHTEIKYNPDFKKFGMNKIDKDHSLMIQKRVFDVAGSNPKLKIYLNGKIITIKSFEDYIKTYTEDPIFEESKDKSWSIGIAPSNDGFQQVSFANSTETCDGGTHLDYVLNQVINHLREFFKKKHKVDVKPSELKNHMFFFLNSTVINPSFSSQTKEKMITEIKDFGYEYKVSETFIKRILKSEIIESILDWIDQKKIADESKTARQLNKSLGKVRVEKLIDAKGKDRWKCSMGIFEGDCLHERTKVRVIDGGDIIDKEIRDIKVDDCVITHNNSIANVYGITKKIKKKAVIKIKDDDIICGHDHKWFIYDTEKNEFYFEITKNINKSKHKLVKNYLAFTDSLLKISSIKDKNLQLLSGDNIVVSPDHKFAVYNITANKFEMIEFEKLDIDNHVLVNTFKL